MSDALSQILMFPKPRLSRKRKPALTSKAVTITDCEVLAEIKEKRRRRKLRKKQRKRLGRSNGSRKRRNEKQIRP